MLSNSNPELVVLLSPLRGYPQKFHYFLELAPCSLLTFSFLERQRCPVFQPKVPEPKRATMGGKTQPRWGCRELWAITNSIRIPPASLLRAMRSIRVFQPA